jgi:excisionase family DNA binding protein
MPMPDLTVAEVAVRLQVTPLTVRRWLRSGSLAGVARDDRAACRIRETDLAAFLDARCRGGVQERPRRPSPVV